MNRQPREIAGTCPLRRQIRLLAIACFACLGAWTASMVPARAQTWQPDPVAKAAAEKLNEQTLRSHIRFLADDLLEGRGPGSRGDSLAQLYLQTQLEGLGLKPGGVNEDGQATWFQSVPLKGVSTVPPTSVKFSAGNESVVLNHHDDMMLSSGKPVSDTLKVSGEMVFVGYGIQAPEYDWDDFKGQDLTGKILVIMNNDPEEDPDLFEGDRRLYYGRWDYKYAMAAKVGAAAAFIIHTEPSAGYPYQVVQTSWAGEQFELAADTGPRTQVNAWLTEEATRKICEMAGKDLDALRQSAQSRNFQPVPLGVTTEFSVQSIARSQDTGNVLAVLEGSDPELKQEHLVFSAHHDHIGLAAERDENQDNIYNGAIDNASGTAMVLSIAKVLAEMEERPKRSILFAFVGAEEQGLLGSKHLAQFPPFPAGYMAAVINVDGINFLGKTHDLSIVGSGKSDLDATIESVAAYQGRVVLPDQFPDRGYYYRSDQFSFAQVGVPGVYLDGGLNYVGKPAGWGKEQIDRWVKEKYHQRSDEHDETWNLEGAIEDARLLYHAGWLIANQPELPAWMPGDEFEAARKEKLSER